MVSALKDVLGKDLCPIAKEQVNAWLSGSRYPVDSTLPTRDWIQLANVVRADEVLEFEVKPAGAGYEMNVRFTLARDESLRDSLAKTTGEDISKVAKLAVAELRKLRTMLPHEVSCYRAGRARSFAAAEVAGRAALAAYPGNIARLCLATALREAQKNPDEVVALSEAVRRTDPNNMLALLHLLNTYYEKSDQAKYAEIGTAMLSIDPASQYAENIIANLASWKMTDAALKLLEKSLQDDPENVNLRQIDFRLVYSADNLKEAQRKGEALARLDSASVDSAFVMKMVSAYVRDSQPDRAIEWLARGTQKFPENASMGMAHAQQLQRQKQIPRAIAEYKRVLRMNPETRRIRLYITNAYNDLGQTDSAVAWARRAAEGGEDRSEASGVVLQIGNKLFQAAQQSRSADDYKKAIPYLAYADSLAENLSARFLWGAAALGIAGQMLQSMQPPNGQPSCAPMKEAQVWIATANERLLQGARSQPAQAPTLLGQAQQFLDYAESQIRTLRCPPN